MSRQQQIRLIKRCSCRRPSYGFQDQVRLIVLLACFLGHLALFQLVDTSTLPFGGNANDNASHYKGRSRGQAVISLVPEEDRGMFVVYHLAKAVNFATPNKNNIAPRIMAVEAEIPQKKSLTFKDIRTYDTFSADLLKWTIQTFGLSQFDVYSLVRRYQVLCTSKGLCFNPNDIGSMCCPF